MFWPRPVEIVNLASLFMMKPLSCQKKKTTLTASEGTFLRRLPRPRAQKEVDSQAGARAASLQAAVGTSPLGEGIGAGIWGAEVRL